MKSYEIVFVHRVKRLVIAENMFDCANKAEEMRDDKFPSYEIEDFDVFKPQERGK